MGAKAKTRGAGGTDPQTSSPGALSPRGSRSAGSKGLKAGGAKAAKNLGAEESKSSGVEGEEAVRGPMEVEEAEGIGAEGLRAQGAKSKRKRKKSKAGDGGDGPESQKNEATEGNKGAEGLRSDSVGGLGFSKDGKVLMAIWLNRVEVLSPLSGQRLLSLEGHERAITALTPHPLNVSQAFTASLDGTLRLWDISDGAAIKVWNLKQPLRHLVVSPDARHAYATVVKTASAAEDGGKSYITRIDLNSGKQLRLCKTKRRAKLALSANGRLLFGVAKKDLLLLPLPDEKDQVHEPVRLSHARDVVAVSVHPEGKFVATGDERGEIFLWYNVLEAANPATPEKKEEVVCSKHNMHWHSTAVRDLAVSHDGHYLLSGGEEGVLVLWQLETGHRQFLPRLGGAIKGIAVSPCSTVVAVQCAEQTIQLVNLLTRKVQKSLKMLPIANTSEGAKGSAGQGVKRMGFLGVDPKNYHVMLNPRGTSLQFWDALKGKHYGTVEATNRNVVSGGTLSASDPKSKDPQPRILLASLSPDGNSLALVHGTPPLSSKSSGPQHPEGPGAEGLRAQGSSQLSFWGKAEGQFQAQTRVVSPHIGGVEGLAHSPSADLVVSAGNDGAFKLWNLQAGNSNTTGNLDLTWRCTAVGTFRPVPCKSVSFSKDGSLIAVSFGSAVGLWTTNDLSLRRVLDNPSVSENITHLSFLAGGTSLVSGSSGSVTLWDLKTCSVFWSYSGIVESISAHPTLPSLALSMTSGEDSNVLLCDQGSAVPSKVWRVRGSGAKGVEACSVMWVKGAKGPGAEGLRGQGFSLVCLGPTGGFVSLSPSASEDEGTRGSGAERLGAEDLSPKPSAYGAMFGASSGTKKGQGTQVSGTKESSISSSAAAVVDGPSHILPLPSTLVSDFLLHLLPAAPPASGSMAPQPRQRSLGGSDFEEAEGAGGHGDEGVGDEDKGAEELIVDKKAKKKRSSGAEGTQGPSDLGAEDFGTEEIYSAFSSLGIKI